MKIRHGFRFGTISLLAALVLFGCSARARFYPVQGPLSAETPPPVFAGKLTVNASFRSGTLSAQLSDGESFRGTLSLVETGTRRRMGQADATPAAIAGMDKLWDLIYGDGYYLAHVLGEGQYGRAVITGSKGTLLQLEIHSAVVGNAVSQPKGVAKDGKGNVYKVVLG
jgi:hypothetical protein